MTCHFTCTPGRYLWKNFSSRFALRSGKEISQACIVHTWVVPEMLFTPVKQVWSHRKSHPALLMTESCSAKWCFQTAPTASSGLVLLSLNILPTYNPPKSKILPLKHGDGCEHPSSGGADSWMCPSIADWQLWCSFQRLPASKDKCEQCFH